MIQKVYIVVQVLELYLYEASIDISNNPLYSGLRVQNQLSFSSRESLLPIQLVEVAHNLFTPTTQPE